ncbi:MAG: NAD(P)-dependent oxidoreductase [Verrucomicrobiota bacterium]|nr:NAD(P)-dependent oxidoreductase [Verrucomicrobiota bacterium]
MVDVIDFDEKRFVPTRVAFVGVGRMGANMARRLKDLGFNVTAVYDVNRVGAKALAKEIGCAAPEKLSEVSASADVIITVVTNDASMRSIFLAKGDNLLTSARSRIFVNCATLSPAIHLEVEKAAQKAGAKTLEACMASSITQARNGTLYLMCGGDVKVFEKVSPILNAMSVICRFVGKAGDAAKVKALVNMVMNINTAGLAEGLGLADAMKLDLSMVREVFSQTGANSRVLVTDGEDMQNRDHSCFFSGEHAAKDSGIALALAAEAKLNLPVAVASKAQFDKMVKLGIGDLDKSGVAELTFKGRTLHKK